MDIETHEGEGVKGAMAGPAGAVLIIRERAAFHEA
jgi:hypothetical protein